MSASEYFFRLGVGLFGKIFTLGSNACDGNRLSVSVVISTLVTMLDMKEGTALGSPLLEKYTALCTIVTTIIVMALLSVTNNRIGKQSEQSNHSHRALMTVLL